MNNKIKIPIAKPYLDDSDKKIISSVLDSDFLSGGPYLKKFEEKFAEFIKTPFSCAVSSGTAGLHLAVKALGIGPGDEVITSPFSFIASSNCILYEKAKPIFVDIDEDTFNINPEKIEMAITEKTKAILVPHIFGQAAEMDKIMSIAQKHRLMVIEDACESLGALYRKIPVGSFGNVGVFAFYPNKQMTTGEGGMVVTNSQKVDRLCKSLRNQGRSKGDKWLESKILGYNYRLDEMSAALGISQLKKLNWMIKERRKIANLYNKELSVAKGIKIPHIALNRTHTWFVYVIKIFNGKRDLIMKRLSAKGVQTRNYLPVIHLQPFMQKMFGYKHGSFPIAEKISRETLALPMFIGLQKEAIKYICDEIKKN